MADFIPAFNRTVMRSEGGRRDDLGYVNRAADLGGETILGISRIWHKDASLWPIVDGRKTLPGFPQNLNDRRQAIVESAAAIYRSEYWRRVRGDAIPDQLVAEKMFDIAVLIDPADAGRFLQRLLNVFNRRGALWADIKVDGGIGPKTLTALNQYFAKRKDPARLVAYLNALLGEGRVALAERLPSQEENIFGWGARLWTD